jgi:cellulose synthase/poly-beta-1,6-N-acetylglucosamine synthase-like glycosyltransferase
MAIGVQINPCNNEDNRKKDQMSESKLLENALAKGAVSEQDAERVLRFPDHDVVELLQTLEILPARQIVELLADTYGIDAISLTTKTDHLFPYVETDDEFVRTSSGQRYVNERWMPIRLDADTNTVHIAVSKEPCEDINAQVKGEFPDREISYHAATIWDMRQRLLEIYADRIAYDAVESLYEKNPSQSAKIVFNKAQKVTGLVSAVVLLGLLIASPFWFVAVAMVVMGFAFLGSIIFKYVISLAGAHSNNVNKYVPGELEALVDDDLPIYTVLVPVFREENIVHLLINNLGQLDYPKEKLEVLILTEEEDQATRDAIEAANPPSYFRTIIIPKGKPGDPQTKPRACNVGLYFASGEFVVIYDAEDKPDADQLKKAIIAFRKGGEKVICVQAALNYFNDEENTLTTMFTLEYSFWFDYMLSGLDAYKFPIPLGGTSNHFRKDALNELGGWDGWNVTEDADLGIRASVLGYTVQTIDSTTMEEANTSIPNFIRQRSRWIKGYMQTAIVHARNPLYLLKEIGFKQTAGFLLLIAGTPITFLAVLPLYLVFILALIIPLFREAFVYLPDWAIVLALFNFILGNGLMVHLSMMGPFKRRRFRLIFWSFLNPIYWLLHSVAAYQGLWELFFKPHYWQKTLHGLTKEQND